MVSSFAPGNCTPAAACRGSRAVVNPKYLPMSMQCSREAVFSSSSKLGAMLSSNSKILALRLFWGGCNSKGESESRDMSPRSSERRLKFEESEKVCSNSKDDDDDDDFSGFLLPRTKDTSGVNSETREGTSSSAACLFFAVGFCCLTDFIIYCEAHLHYSFFFFFFFSIKAPSCHHGTTTEGPKRRENDIACFQTTNQKNLKKYQKNQLYKIGDISSYHLLSVGSLHRLAISANC